jgi:hypothetical protein
MHLRHHPPPSSPATNRPRRPRNCLKYPARQPRLARTAPARLGPTPRPSYPKTAYYCTFSGGNKRANNNSDQKYNPPNKFPNLLRTPNPTHHLLRVLPATKMNGYFNPLSKKKQTRVLQQKSESPSATTTVTKIKTIPKRSHLSNFPS